MRRYVLLGLGLAIAAAVLVLYLKDRAQGGWLQAEVTDMNRTRSLVSLLLTHKKESPPVAADGRIDVYAGLLVTTQAQVDEIYRSERLDLGPDAIAGEIQIPGAGDPGRILRVRAAAVPRGTSTGDS